MQAASSKVYIDNDSLPDHPGSSWTRFVCISDTHSRRFSIPPGDVLLHAGDLSSWGYYEQLAVTVEWLKSLPHPTKIIISGNHDLCLDETCGEIESEDISNARTLIQGQDIRDAGIRYLEYEALRFRTPAGREWIVYGSPATPRYALGAFQYTSANEANAIYDRIPLETEILITHTPPFNVLDKTRRDKHAGCSILKKRLTELHSCQLHVFGHIHEAHGACTTTEPNLEADVDRISVNAAVYGSARVVVVDLKN